MTGTLDRRRAGSSLTSPLTAPTVTDQGLSIDGARQSRPNHPTGGARTRHRCVGRGHEKPPPSNAFPPKKLAPHRGPSVTSHFHGHINQKRVLGGRPDAERQPDASLSGCEAAAEVGSLMCHWSALRSPLALQASTNVRRHRSPGQWQRRIVWERVAVRHPDHHVDRPKQ